MEINASGDGTRILLSTAGETKFSFETTELNSVIERLLRILPQPNVLQHLPIRPHVAPGTIAELRPHQLAAISVTKVLLVEQVGLLLELIGGLRLYFQFSQNDASTLSQQLLGAVQQLQEKGRPIRQ